MRKDPERMPNAHPRAKKSLGQNFLRSTHIADLIAESAHITKKDTVLEIGPGRGILTRALLARAKKVIAVEKDPHLIPELALKFKGELVSGRLKLCEDDILEFDLPKHDLRAGNYILAANIPYYITGPILRAFVGGEHHPLHAVLLVQHEVARRIIARDKKESILSIAIKAYGTAKYIKKVPSSFFSPAPKVDSAILLIENISRKNFGTGVEEKRFFEIIHAAFAHKRKKLGGNLKPLLGEQATEILARCDIDPHARAEDVALPKWLCLARTTQQAKS